MKEKQLLELVILGLIVLVILYAFLIQQRREERARRQRRSARRQVGTNAKLSLTAQS